MSTQNFLGKLNDQLTKFSEGRSDSFFIYSPDRKYIIKTINAVEAGILLKMLPSLHHVRNNYVTLYLSSFLMQLFFIVHKSQPTFADYPLLRMSRSTSSAW